MVCARDAIVRRNRSAPIIAEQRQAELIAVLVERCRRHAPRRGRRKQHKPRDGDLRRHQLRHEPAERMADEHRRRTQACARIARSLARNPSGPFARAVRDRRRVRDAASSARAFRSPRLRTVRGSRRTPSRRKTRRARTRPALRFACALHNRDARAAPIGQTIISEAPTRVFLEPLRHFFVGGALERDHQAPAQFRARAQRQSTELRRSVYRV